MVHVTAMLIVKHSTRLGLGLVLVLVLVLVLTHYCIYLCWRSSDQREPTKP